MHRFRILGFVAGVATIGARAAQGVTVPFTEDFSTNANWRQATAANVVNVSATGGPSGGAEAYATYDRSFSTSTSQFIVFRGQTNLTSPDGDSSGGAFAGNWISAGIDNLSYYVRQNSPEDMIFGIRIATAANSSAINILPATNIVHPNTWTQLSFAISPSNPSLVEEGPPGTYTTALSSVGNVQIEVQRTTSNALANAVTLDLDKVTITPEPASIGLAATGGALLLLRRRRAQ